MERNSSLASPQQAHFMPYLERTSSLRRSLDFFWPARIFGMCDAAHCLESPLKQSGHLRASLMPLLFRPVSGTPQSRQNPFTQSFLGASGAAGSVGNLTTCATRMFFR